MAINLMTPNREADFKPRITVIGVGGAGGNAVNNMIRANLEGVDFLVCNTDAQAMSHTLSERRLQLGADLTQGLGAGSKPDVGRAAAEESLGELMEQLSGNHMVFVTAGMGGGTGTGAAPVIARACREQGMLTVGVVTKPFLFEGRQRMKLAEEGIRDLQQYVDTLIVIPNQNLFRVANEKTTFADAFKMADDVLFAGVRSVTDLMVMPGLINLDFADIRSVMAEMGKAMMGTGEAEGDKRAIEAAEAAIANPLLEDLSMKSARGLLINITGSLDMTLMEVDEAVNRILEEVDSEADMIFGSTFDDGLEGRIRISVVATGIDAGEQIQVRPVPIIRPQPIAEAEPETAAEAGPATDPEPAIIAAGGGDNAEAGDVLTLLDGISASSSDAPAAAPVEIPPEIEPDSFIPPAPAHPEQQPAALDPFVETALENGVDEIGGKRKKLTLFERVAEAAGVVSGERRPHLNQRVEPVAAPATAPAPAPSPSIQSTAPSSAAKDGHQSRLGGLEPVGVASRTEAEGEMLDIPAFLRRQAN
ncbi:MAG: cell division protein FtsZ [Rhodospirillales bacterium]|nr:MAG: cell division protein FtsZ [Rhodospirillales bacterium]